MITQSQLFSRLHYNPDTGVFTFVDSGLVAGRKHSRGYLTIQLFGKRYLLHRLAVLYMTGAFPEQDIDHGNGDREDNRWDNIKPVSFSENQQNRGGPQKNNKLGLLGVRRFGAKFMAQLQHKGEKVYLGLHETPEAAHAAYMAAKAMIHTNSPRLLGYRG